MAKTLPKIDLPIFEDELISSGEKVKYRPFTVKEEKILLVAQESKDLEQAVLSIKQIVNNCLIDKDASELAMFDIQYILLLLRSKSVDNNVSFSIKDPDTEETIEMDLDISDIKIIKSEDHSDRVKINDEYTLFLKYPKIDQFVEIVKGDPKDPNINYYIMISCLDKVASEDEVYNISEYSDEEIDEFMEGLQGDVVSKITKFFETMPVLRHEMKYTNSEGNEKTFVIEGIQSFFI